MRDPPPVEAVRQRLSSHLTPDQLSRLPQGYFRLGHVLVLDLPLPHPEQEVARAYAEVLGKRSVLGREGGIEGEFREPRMRLLWGDPNTETEHQEYGVRYRLDPARVMWSQGNLQERGRVSQWRVDGETIVDLFAGVGYWTLPLAVHGMAAKVVAIEKNPTAFHYLEENIQLNGAGDRVQALLGDCRDVAPRDVADRVILGLLPDALPFLETALRALKPTGGWIHVHRVTSAKKSGDECEDEVGDAVERLHRSVRAIATRRIKSYGPRREHIVVDVEVAP